MTPRLGARIAAALSRLAHVTAAVAPPPAPGAGALRAGEALRLACWFALVGGLPYVALVGARKYGFGETVRENPQVVWMAPAALLVVLALVAAILLAAARAWPRRDTRRVAVGAFAFLALLNVVLGFERVHQTALALLATGIAVQAVRFASARPAAFDRLVRRTLVPMVALVAAMGVGLNGWLYLTERRAAAALPPARAGAPNVLLIILDTVRSASLSLQGYGRRTSPVLERIAARGVAFDRAIATAPWTLPSHASVFTGLWPHDHGATWGTPLGDGPRTLAEALAERGYRTGGFVANLHYTTREFGLARGFARYEDYAWTMAELALNSPLAAMLLNRPELRRITGDHDLLNRLPAEAISRRMLDWVDEDRSRPFFAFVNYFDAHDPYLPKPPFDTLFGPPGIRAVDRITLWRRNGGLLFKGKLSRSQRRGVVDAYDGAIAEADFEVGRLLDSLRARGVLENTLVIVTSDHGELFGENRLWEHGRTPFYRVVHVPLVVSWPGHVPEGVRVPQAVSIRDIPSSVMELVGARRRVFPGRSLVRRWLGDTTRAPVLAELSRDPTAVSRGQTTGLVRVLSMLDGDWHYLRTGDGREMLFDIAVDPAETHDLAAEPSHRGTLRALRARADSVVSQPPA